jgi:hypothetical protein
MRQCYYLRNPRPFFPTAKLPSRRRRGEGAGKDKKKKNAYLFLLPDKIKGAHRDMATTPTPTLPADWAPTGCLQPSDFWIWDYNRSADRRTALGGPSQTTECFPTPWPSAGLYLGAGCPRGYTSACGPAPGDPDGVTCCPT